MTQPCADQPEHTLWYHIGLNWYDFMVHERGLTTFMLVVFGLPVVIAIVAPIIAWLIGLPTQLGSSFVPLVMCVIGIIFGVTATLWLLKGPKGDPARCPKCPRGIPNPVDNP